MSVILSIDMTDPTGGTGVHAAMKCAHALGGYACSVVTALSVQTLDNVLAIHAADHKVVKAQLDVVRESYDIKAVVIGLLPNKKIVDVVSDFLDDIHDDGLFVVLDPIMSSHSGYKFLDPKARQEIKRRLMVHADIITPNVYEAEKLTGVNISTNEEAEQAAEMLMTLGCRSVLIKQIFVKDGQIFDLFLDSENFYTVESPLIESKNIHGAGITLATAIATSVALGLDLPHAVSGARSYLAETIENATQVVEPDKTGPVDQFV